MKKYCLIDRSGKIVYIDSRFIRDYDGFREKYRNLSKEEISALEGRYLSHLLSRSSLLAGLLKNRIGDEAKTEDENHQIIQQIETIELRSFRLFVLIDQDKRDLQSIRHDLKNMLGNIKGLVQLAEMDGGINKRYIEFLHEEFDKMAELFEHIDQST